MEYVCEKKKYMYTPKPIIKRKTPFVSVNISCDILYERCC